MVDSIPTTQQIIANELRQINEFYGGDKNTFESILQQLDLSDYVEIVLNTEGFEIVTGGMGKEAPLIEFAESMNFPQPVIDCFTSFAIKFTGRMIYTKVSTGSNAKPPSMYFVALEPWENIFAFLKNLPEIQPAIPALQEAIGKSALCFLIGFTIDPATNKLVVKTYHLYGRQEQGGKGLPFLVSHRLSNGQLLKDQKHYTAKVGWDHFKDNEDWQKLAEFGANLFGSNYAMLFGESLYASAGNHIKAYIFRLDTRENEIYQLKSYNYYLEEGIRLMQVGNLEAAIDSLLNAIYFQKDDFSAYSNLAICYMRTGQYLNALDITYQVKELNPDFFNPVLSDEEYEQALAQLEKDKNTIPAAQFYNQRGIFHFQKGNYQRALSDMEEAIKLHPYYADAYNNLGGIYLRMGKTEQAYKACEKAFQLSNGQIEQTNYLLSKGIRDMSMEIAQQASALHHQQRGVYYYQVGLLEEAKADFLRAEALNAV